MGAASAPPNTRSKDKEGPSTARKGREGTARKEERPTLAVRGNHAELVRRNR